MACVIYCRQSDVTNDKRTADDADTLSLEAQFIACRAFTARMGWSVAETYGEQFSGFSDQRVQYQRMLGDIKANHREHPPGDPARIAHLVVYKYARLSREPATLTATIGMLKAAGVEVEPVTDQKLGGGKLDDMMLYIMSSFGKIQVQDSTEHAKAARKALTDKGLLVCSGKARYGYKYDTATRTRIIDEAAAKVVRKIFDWYCEGHSAHVVQHLLLDEGIPSPGGLPRWTLKTIRDIVKDASYKGGSMRIAKTERITDGGYYPSGGRKCTKVTSGVEVGDGTPAIVTPAVWARANELVGSRTRAVTRHSRDWLVGRVYCSTCGVRLSRYLHSARKYWYWRCNNYQLYRECDNKLGHAHDRLVRAAATEQLARFLDDPKIREAKLATLRENLADPEWEAEADRNTREIGRLKAKMAKVLAAFGDDDALAEMLAGQVETLKGQIAAREEIAVSLAGKIAASRRATEAVDTVRGLLGPWPTGLLDGPDGPRAFEALGDEDKRLVASTVGLRVEVARLPGVPQVAVQVRVFDFEFLNSFSLERPLADISCG